MPVKVNSQLPAVKLLEADNIFVMYEAIAAQQDIRTLNILVVNLMPRKMVTETQILALLSNTPLQINVDFLHMMTHKSKNITQNHLDTFYKSFDDIKADYYDGMIVTGAPVENLAFEAVDYWDELHQILDWSRSHVYSTLHICWGAQAGLYARYGISKHALDQKLWGVYHQTVENPKHVLFRGFDDEFYMPHSRHTDVRKEDIEACSALEILATSEEAGVSIVRSRDNRFVFVTGHAEYDFDTLDKEYKRDVALDRPINIPINYYPDNDPGKRPVVRWRGHANILFVNWLNYFVYQETPFDLQRIHELRNKATKD